MKYKTYVWLLVFFNWSSLLIAQSITPITKAEVLNAVLEDNYTIKITQESYNEAKADYKQTQAVFFPNIAVSHTGLSTTNPLMAFGSKLNQGIITVDDFNPQTLNNPDQTQNFATKFEIQQPLINVDGFYQRKAAKDKMQAMSLQVERTNDYLKLEAEKAYMQLQLAYKAIAVLQQSLDAALANKKMAEDKFDQGYLQRADVLAVEVRVTEVKNQLQQAKTQLENVSNYLSYIMNTESDVVFRPTDSLQIDSNVSFGKLELSKDRSDIKAMEFVTDAYETMYKADKMNFLPRLNAFGSYELYDDKIFQGNANGYIIGAQLSWTVLDGTKRFGKVKKSKAILEKSKWEFEQYKSESQLELNKAKRMLVDAEQKLQLSELALEQSKEALRIRTDRFQEGLEKTTDLLLTETQYAQKQLIYYQTIFEYNYAQAYVRFLTQ
ncbi:TolC family protein [Hanstruepera marina]|uniref:TolC family protein n=1 Tax=Hanstruepera marina TaxID=2873265 RepID=UPI001CA728AA|nr:TolC family protein [Hanstruepera marina]